VLTNQQLGEEELVGQPTNLRTTELVFDRSTKPDGTIDSFVVRIGNTCYVGCKTGHAGGVGNGP